MSVDYFETMGIPVRRGRVFRERDVEGQSGVVVVSESLAARAWPGQDALGKRLKIPLPGTPYHDVWIEVVGVVADVCYRELTTPRLDLYMSYLQANHRAWSLVVRTSSDPLALAVAVRREARALDPDLPVDEATAMTEVVAGALGGPRFTLKVFGAFAVVALLLAGLGLYGILAYSVTRRTREIGVRVALGARPADVRRLVLVEGFVLTACGIGLGLGGAAVTARLIRSLLYGVGPADPVTFAAVPVLLAAVAVAASLLPVRRALGVDPATALRAE